MGYMGIGVVIAVWVWAEFFELTSVLAKVARWVEKDERP
jgi:hypothetical protein